MMGWNWKSDIREAALAPAGIMYSAAGAGASAWTGKPADLKEKQQDRRRRHSAEEDAGEDRGKNRKRGETQKTG